MELEEREILGSGIPAFLPGRWAASPWDLPDISSPGAARLSATQDLLHAYATQFHAWDIKSPGPDRYSSDSNREALSSQLCSWNLNYLTPYSNAMEFNQFVSRGPQLFGLNHILKMYFSCKQIHLSVWYAKHEQSQTLRATGSGIKVLYPLQNKGSVADTMNMFEHI